MTAESAFGECILHLGFSFGVNAGQGKLQDKVCHSPKSLLLYKSSESEMGVLRKVIVTLMVADPGSRPLASWPRFQSC